MGDVGDVGGVGDVGDVGDNRDTGVGVTAQSSACRQTLTAETSRIRAKAPMRAGPATKVRAAPPRNAPAMDPAPIRRTNRLFSRRTPKVLSRL